MFTVAPHFSSRGSLEHRSSAGQVSVVKFGLQICIFLIHCDIL